MLLNITSQNKFDIYVDDPQYILIRLYEVTKTTKPQELAEILHTDISDIATLMEENPIPMYGLMVLHATNNVSPMWILFGRRYLLQGLLFWCTRSSFCMGWLAIGSVIQHLTRSLSRLQNQKHQPILGKNFLQNY